MAYLRIAIDGACRNNGKPDCVSAGGVFVQLINENGEVEECYTESTYEEHSTSQRGELMALYCCLNIIKSKGLPAQIITDSEYMFNTVTRRWYDSWLFANWKTSRGDAVKNKDLWERIVDTIYSLESDNIDFSMYHIKGHVMPYGKVGGVASLNADPSGKQLYDLAKRKFVDTYDKLLQKLQYAQELSVKNNGFEFDDDTLKTFVIANVVADLVATREVDAVKIKS